MAKECKPHMFKCALREILKYVEPIEIPEHTEEDELRDWQDMQQRDIDEGGSWDSD